MVSAIISLLAPDETIKLMAADLPAEAVSLRVTLASFVEGLKSVIAHSDRIAVVIDSIDRRGGQPR